MSTFSIVPQSSTHIRIIYRNFYCLDLQCRLGRFVSVRDGAYSTFETNKVVDCLNPIPNLQVRFQLLISFMIYFISLYLLKNVSQSF